jgi:hypothetical protein
MDFLDPKEKRKRAIRLAIGYGLMIVLVAVATVVLVFQAYGFDLDRRGNVVQNGLIFFDSTPDGANISLNGELQGRQTNVRMSLTEGRYDIELTKDGYRNWNRSLLLEGGTVERVYYPLLIPQILSSNELQTYAKSPATVLQSPDKRWMLVSQPGSLTKFVKYDLNQLDDNDVPVATNVNLPASLFRSSPGAHELKLVEWSTDNNSVLVKHTYNGGSEFVLLNHDKPAESVNLNSVFSAQFDSVTLFDKKPDQFYLHSKKNNRLRIAELDSGQIEPFINGVLAYKSHGDDDLLYYRLSPDKQNTRVILRLGDEEYVLRDIEGKPDILLDLASFDRDWYPAFSVGREKKAYVYKNPHDFINDNEGDKPAPVMVLKLHSDPKALSFSQNASKIAAYSGQEFSVYDIEFENPYRFTIRNKFDTSGKPTWMGGHRLIAHSGGDILIFDYDGKNKQKLIPSISSRSVIFDQDFERMYTLGSSQKKPKKNTALMQTNLRTDADL